MMSRMERTNLTFAEVFHRWYESAVVGQVKEETAAQYRSAYDAHLEDFFGSLRVDAITLPLIREFADLESRHYLSGMSIERILNVLGLVLAWAQRHGFAKTNPLKRGRVFDPEHDEVHYLSLADALRIAECVPDAWRTPVLTAIYTGLTQRELFALYRSDVDWDERIISVRHVLVNGRLEMREGYKRRVVAIPDALEPALREHLLLLPTQEDGLLFSAPDGGFIDPVAFQAQVYRPACGRAGVRDAGFPQLRHAFGRTLGESGLSLHDIRDVMGLASVRSAAQYVSSDTDAAYRAAAAMDAASSEACCGGFAV